MKDALNPYMKELNFPAYPVRTKYAGDKMLIFDSIRKKYIALTPEEWVRQHLINYLITEKHCPASLISIETPLKCVQMNKRSDVTVHHRNGQPLLLVECKAPEIALTQKVFEQISVYHMAIQAVCLMVTNGLQHYCMTTLSETISLHFLDHIPDYQELVKMHDAM